VHSELLAVGFRYRSTQPTKDISILFRTERGELMYKSQITDKAKKSYERDHNLHTYILFGIQYDYPICDELLRMMVLSYYVTPGLTEIWESEGLDWEELDDDSIRTICTSDSISVTINYIHETMPERTFVQKLSSDSVHDGLEVWTLSVNPPNKKVWTRTTQRYVSRQHVMDFYDNLRSCDRDFTPDI
jgi:hypothetical protein